MIYEYQCSCGKKIEHFQHTFENIPRHIKCECGRLAFRVFSNFLANFIDLKCQRLFGHRRKQGGLS
jgi:hypothetical protein